MTDRFAIKYLIVPKKDGNCLAADVVDIDVIAKSIYGEDSEFLLDTFNTFNMVM